MRPQISVSCCCHHERYPVRKLLSQCRSFLISTSLRAKSKLLSFSSSGPRYGACPRHTPGPGDKAGGERLFLIHTHGPALTFQSPGPLPLGLQLPPQMSKQNILIPWPTGNAEAGWEAVEVAPGAVCGRTARGLASIHLIPSHGHNRILCRSPCYLKIRSQIKKFKACL